MTLPYVENRVVIRGAGDVASGVIKKLFIAGYEVVALEQKSPSCVRRLVSFAEAIHEKSITVEGITARFASSAEDAVSLSAQKRIPIMVDPRAETLHDLKPLALIDARLLKKDIDSTPDMAPIVIGLGPGFTTGINCHAAIETKRGFDLGRIIYTGSPHADTGKPASVNGATYDRVLRAPSTGRFSARMKLTDMVTFGQTIGHVDGNHVISRIDGIIRGLIRDGSEVAIGQKIGDIDPRGIKEYCYKISDKANAIGGGVLEALMVLRSRLMISS